MSSEKEAIIRNIKSHIDKVRVPLYRVGEALGSGATTRQGKIKAATDFLSGGIRAFNLEKVMRLEQFFNVSFQKKRYHIGHTSGVLADGQSPIYGDMHKINNAGDAELDTLFEDLIAAHPEIIRGVKLSTITPGIKRMLLRAHACS